MSTAHRIPYDLLVLFALAGGYRLAVSMAVTCRDMKRRIDQRFVVTTRTFVDKIVGNPGLVGKFTSFFVETPTDVNNLPSSTTDVIISNNFALDNIRFPDTVESIGFGCGPSQPLEKFPFPPNVTSISLGFNFNQSVDHLVWPPKLRTLIFPEKYTRPITRLPPSLHRLQITQPLRDLPVHLTHLTIIFTGDIRHLVLPSGLKYLSLVLDDTDYHVHLPRLPIGLKVLCLQAGYLRTPLPENLDELIISTHYLPDKLPRVKHLVVKYIRHFPDGHDHIQCLHFHHAFNQPVERLPAFLQKLYFGNYYNQELPYLPMSIKHLQFGERFNQPLLSLPSRLVTLVLGIFFTQPLKDVPASLKTVFVLDARSPRPFHSDLIQQGFQYSCADMDVIYYRGYIPTKFHILSLRRNYWIDGNPWYSE